jgi:hypothetical protein
MRATFAAVVTAMLLGPGATAIAETGCRPGLREALEPAGLTDAQLHHVCAVVAGIAVPPSESPALIGGSDGSHFDSDLLEPELGIDEPWKKFLVAGHYTLQNKSDAGSGMIVLAERPPSGWRRIAARVRFVHEPMAEGIAGAALAFEPAARGGDVVVVALQNDGTMTATRIGEGGFVPLAARSDRRFAILGDAYVELALRAGDGGSELLVDGQPTGLAVPVAAGANGSVGIAAFGIGSFEFASFVREPR